MTLYEKAVVALPAEHIDHHASDLYLKVTPESKALLQEWIRENGFENAAKGRFLFNTFRSHLDGALWYDIAFQYTPYWDAITQRFER